MDYVEVTYFMLKRGVLILMGIAMLFLSGCTIGDWQ